MWKNVKPTINVCMVRLIILIIISYVMCFINHGFCSDVAEELMLDDYVDPQHDFSVLNFGAKGDGVTDDSEAARAAACRVQGGVMLVPAGYTFLLQPISFSGTDCIPNFTIQVDGQVVAPGKVSEWKRTDVFCWICFTGFGGGITIRGNGVFDGQGNDWWLSSVTISAATATSRFVNAEDTSDDGHAQMVDEFYRPHAVVVTDSNDVIIYDITIRNSPRMHLYIQNSQKVHIYKLTVSSPGNSPNTDAVHFSNSQHVQFHDSRLSCGDDCVSIQDGCSDVTVSQVECNPGHGYSIGGLGKDGARNAVQDVIVRDCTVVDSKNGARIKTWQGGSGYVRNVTFSDIQVSRTERPIVIDQYYCDGAEHCGEAPGAVEISGITFENIQGTYTYQPVYLACSRTTACTDVNFRGYLSLHPAGVDPELYCVNAFGTVSVENPMPPLDGCLLN